MNKRTGLLLGVLGCVLCGCHVGPDYVRTPVAMPRHFKEAQGHAIINAKNTDWKRAHPRDHIDRGPWWKIFHDKKLNELEGRLNISNQTIAAAYANYCQAMALVDEARASYFPTLNGTISFTRQKQGGGATSFVSNSNGVTSTGTASTGGAATTQSSRITNSHTILFNASWVPDIWGLVYRQVQASEAGAQASGALLASTRLAAQASLAQFYFELRALDTDQQLLDATVRNYYKALQLTKNQYRSGVVARADVVQAQSQLETAKAQAINNGINRAIFEHAIAVLIGVAPADLNLSPRPLRAQPPPVPVGIPCELLERRPDVAQAERLMAQANAEIGVAVAAYFPTLTLTATGSFFGKGLSHWISLPALGWAYGPQLSQLIYDGGLRAATVRAAKAGYQSTLASYRQIVLTAMQNVEDDLATIRILNREAVVQNAAAADAVKALSLVINQYKSGVVPYSSVITAQTAAFTAQKTAADVTGLRMTATVGLITALGGGWEQCCTR